MNLELTIEDLVEPLQSNIVKTNVYGRFNFIILTKEKIQEGVYDNDFQKFLFQLEPGTFRGTLVVVNKFAEFIQKEVDRQAQLQTAKILPPWRQM